MDKIFSARLDESIIRRIDVLSKQMNSSKKAVIERAILVYAEKFRKDNNQDIFQQTCGTWRRKESADKTVKRARKAFRKSMYRLQK